MELPADRDIAGWSEQVGREIQRSAPPIDVPEPTVEASRELEEAAPPTDPLMPTPPMERLRDTGDGRGGDAFDIATDLFGENLAAFWGSGNWRNLVV